MVLKSKVKFGEGGNRFETNTVTILSMGQVVINGGCCGETLVIVKKKVKKSPSIRPRVLNVR